MTLTPCRTCHLADGCVDRVLKIRAVRGLKLTAIKFKCALLTESFLPGMRVQADLHYVATGRNSYGEIITRKQTVDAVVMGWSRDKVRIYVPYGSDGEWWLESIKNGGGDCVHVLRVLL